MVLYFYDFLIRAPRARLQRGMLLNDQESALLLQEKISLSFSIWSIPGVINPWHACQEWHGMLPRLAHQRCPGLKCACWSEEQPLGGMAQPFIKDLPWECPLRVGKAGGVTREQGKEEVRFWRRCAGKQDVSMQLSPAHCL